MTQLGFFVRVTWSTLEKRVSLIHHQINPMQFQYFRVVPGQKGTLRSQVADFLKALPALLGRAGHLSLPPLCARPPSRPRLPGVHPRQGTNSLAGNTRKSQCRTGICQYLRDSNATLQIAATSHLEGLLGMCQNRGTPKTQKGTFKKAYTPISFQGPKASTCWPPARVARPRAGVPSPPSGSPAGRSTHRRGIWEGETLNMDFGSSWVGVSLEVRERTPVSRLGTDSYFEEHPNRTS